ELQSRLTSGETMWQIAQDQGLSEDEFVQAMTDAHAEALEKAVAEGVITQEQADWMSQHMSQMGTAGFGACPGWSTTNP
ncbi:MAG: LysM peptidoglycan-binding domain-containing protein, partial [Chloroflexota bacterium]